MLGNCQSPSKERFTTAYWFLAEQVTPLIAQLPRRQHKIIISLAVHKPPEDLLGPPPEKQRKHVLCYQTRNKVQKLRLHK